MTGWLRGWAARADETLDDPRADAATVTASLGDIARINRLFGGRAAAVRGLDPYLAEAPPGRILTLLDVGTGGGDIPRALAARAARRGLTLRLVGVERHPAAARAARNGGSLVPVLAEGGCLPFADGAVDFVFCAKLLHHLPGAAGTALLREMDRVARRAAVVADIRRSLFAALGLWLVSWPLRFHPATRRDGVISVFRGFTPEELSDVCRAAGVRADVHRHPGWCLTAAWRPAGVSA
jgi:SAM-dependent methyltransferase